MWVAPAQPPLDKQKADAAHKNRPRDRPQLLRQFEPRLVQRKTPDACDDECQEKFARVISGGLLAPLENELMQPLGEKRQYGNDRTTLDDYVEEVALPRQPMFGDQQVGGRRDRQELGESLNDSENDYSNPIVHKLNQHSLLELGRIILQRLGKVPSDVFDASVRRWMR